MYFFISFYLYLILILKYLFQVAETNYLILKNIFFKYHANIDKCGLFWRFYRKKHNDAIEI